MSLAIKDHTKDYKIKPNNCGKHCDIFSPTIRCVIAGSSGSGKTNLIVDLLKSGHKLNYNDVYVYSATLYQPAYENLKEYYGNIEKMVKYQTNQTIKIAHFIHPDEDEMENPETLDRNKNHIMIFDDVMLKDQTQIKEYFCDGRHSNISMFYLCQSIHKISKQSIRQNENMFILFIQDAKTLKYFFDGHCLVDMDFSEFKEFCDKVWTKDYGFVVLNLWDKSYCGRYWANYEGIGIPNKYYEKKKKSN